MRKKNLAKKSLEISAQCNMDIIILMYDKRYDRYQEFYTNPNLTLKEVNAKAKEAYKDPKIVFKYKKEDARDIAKVECDETMQDNIADIETDTEDHL